jgi:hypothetical protein
MIKGPPHSFPDGKLKDGLRKCPQVNWRKEVMSENEKQTMNKVTWRLVPFLMFCYFIAYLDRVNIGFAGASMSKDLNLTGAGRPVFFS